MTCIRALQAKAGRIGQQITEAYPVESTRVQALRSEESATLRQIEAEHAKGPCRCEDCGDEVPW